MLFVVVGKMFLNPKTRHWEGNEQILRDFHAVVASSSRPALITNLSGQAPSTLVNGPPSATTPKVVVSMLVDPIKVCWVHQLGDALEEVPFAAIDELEKLDEEEGEGWGTIKVNFPPCELGASVGSSSGLIQLLRTDPSPARSFGRTRTRHAQSGSERESVGGSDRGSRMYSREEHERLAAGDVEQWDGSEELLRQCREAQDLRKKIRDKGLLKYALSSTVSMFSEHCAEAAELIGNFSLQDERTLGSHCSLFRSTSKGKSSLPNF